VTTFLLVRHAAHDWLGRGIAGRLPGVNLNEEGRRQALALPGRLAGRRIEQVCCSPQPRTLQTAQPLAQQLGMPVRVLPGFDEIDFGDWMGRSFEHLCAAGEVWEQWVHHRSAATPPGGEPFAGVPLRAMAELRALQREFRDGELLVVSHGDVIKALLAHCLGLSLDHLERFEIAPASLSVLEMGEGWQQVKMVNGG
jgi:broad specificity phosphatase PhoE